MVFRDRTYGVLIVSASEKFNNRTQELLPGGYFWPVESAASGGEARRLLQRRQFDIVIINSPLPDESGMDLASDIGERYDCAVLVLVAAEHFDELSWKLAGEGALCAPKPVTVQVMLQSIRACCAVVERTRLIAGKQRSVKEKMEEIRLVNRAKWALINSRGWDEEEAHRYIEKEAMDRRIPKKTLAEEILAKTAISGLLKDEAADTSKKSS